MTVITGGFNSRNPEDMAKVAGLIFRPATKEEMNTVEEAGETEKKPPAKSLKKK